VWVHSVRWVDVEWESLVRKFESRRSGWVFVWLAGRLCAHECAELSSVVARRPPWRARRHRRIGSPSYSDVKHALKAVLCEGL
jgi:hypothetical protein